MEKEFERNEHGHVVLTLTGLNLTGEQEIARHLASPDAKMCDWAMSCLLSKNSDGYDAKHRLVEGQVYRVALMPTNVIKVDSERTADALRQYGVNNFGYGKGLAGLIPRMREVVSNAEMKSMGFRFIAGLHDLIKDSDGDPNELLFDGGDDGRWLRASWVLPGIRWVGLGAVALLLPAS
ncbi:hypothetical protein A3C89_03700 [Candidatus Kaiserbacteria bacterium RIFCSPHIGHO2_02_FULL_50_50]|uniref:Uncharacterized protein n=1 Tax=Candidatus Kaiserbacteria bacterium RIFCSPHIGHO2_02_FULL_50_50 TaxID=1798492 RepID=A0A1F6DBZ9_9BACT|nr:MAG: hypothetical protein A3C89_03700 [Candidatus Kaiserbacteria bacterium RIFCSPHIGHO2_02_FULL_50_50]OGG88049.1 MAG: hypothetical protein A3G62_01780 [Candidatus Kaiserbacteria bacterium RIFCSPLOWO2_12_FULL_50_10]